MKKSIIIYADCIAILEELSFEQAGRLFKAIISYVNEEPVTEIEGDPAVNMAFTVLRTQIDRDSDKYEEICKKRSEAGKRHKGNQYTRLLEKLEQMEQKFQNGTNGTDNDSDNDNDSDSESTIVDNNIIPSTLRVEGSSHSKADATQPKSFREKVLRHFNEVMACRSIKPIKAINDGTRRSEYLKARVREYGREAVFQMIDKAAGSDFLNGYNKKGFVATFDWLILPNNFIKVLEGNYDNNINNGTKNAAEQRADEVAGIIARLAEENRPVGEV